MTWSLFYRFDNEVPTDFHELRQLGIRCGVNPSGSQSHQNRSDAPQEFIRTSSSSNQPAIACGSNFALCT